MITRTKFTCEGCGRTFLSSHSDEVAMQEYESKFGKNMGEPLAVLCEFCTKDFDRWVAENKIRFAQ